MKDFVREHLSVKSLLVSVLILGACLNGMAPTYKDYIGKTSVGLDLSNKTIVGYDFSGAHLKNCNLSNCTMMNCTFVGTKIQGNLDNLRIRSNPKQPTDFKSVTIYDSSAKKLSIKNVTVIDLDCDSVNLEGGDLSAIVITASTFEKCNMLRLNMSGGIIEDTLFSDIFETRWLNLSETTIEGCTFSKMAFFFTDFNYVRIQASGRKTVFRRCMFILSDFTKASIKDTLMMECFLSYPWNKKGKLAWELGEAAGFYTHAVVPVANSTPYIANPFWIIGIPSFLISTVKKFACNAMTTDARKDTSCVFGEKEDGEYCAGFETSTCKGLDKIRNLSGTSLINVYGLSKQMQEKMEQKGAIFSRDETEAFSAESVLGAAHDLSVIRDNKKTRDAMTSNREMQKKVDKAEGFMDACCGKLDKDTKGKK